MAAAASSQGPLPPQPEPFRPITPLTAEIQNLNEEFLAFHILNTNPNSPTVPSSLDCIKICQDFLQTLLPLYGPKHISIQKLFKHHSYVVFADEARTHPVGLLAYKALLSDKYQGYGIVKGLKIETFFVHPEFFGKKFRTALLRHIYALANQLHASAIYLPVSSYDDSNIAFFQANRFSMIETVVGNCYGAGIHKHLLFKKIESPTSS